MADQRKVRDGAYAAEATFAGIAQISSDAIITVDTDQVITFFNEGAEEIFGYASEEVVGHPLDMLLPRRSRAIHEEHIRVFGESPIAGRRMGERRAITGLRKNGDEFPAEASISKVDVDGVRVYAVALRDITEQHRREEVQRFLATAGTILASSLEYQETLTSIARLAVSSIADWCVIYIRDDDGATSRLEATHSDAEKQALLNGLKHRNLDPTGPNPALTVMETGEAELIAEFTPALLEEIAESADHHRLLIELEPRSAAYAPLIARDRALGAIALVSSGRRYDADDLGLAEELARRAALAVDNARLYRDAEAAIKLREEVLRVVSHDLGNPLSAIHVGLKLLRRQLPSEAAGAVERPLTMIRESAGQLRHLIDDLSEVERIETGQMALDLHPVAPALLLEKVAELLAPLAEENGLVLECEARGNLPDIGADWDRLFQVFGNLIGNAIKFTPADGRVRVTADAREGDVIFAVTDTGPGIASAELPHVFDRFWRSTHAHGDGSGLGLAIAKGIVEAHGGTIRVESERGEGTTFFFRLPGKDTDSR